MSWFDFMNVVLSLPPAAAILLISAVVSFVTTLVYKHTTNQKMLKELKDEVKRMQAEARSATEPGRAAQLQKEMMKKSMQQFSSSTKSMLITLIPLFLLFGWMQSNLAYTPLKPGAEFTTTAYFDKSASGNITIAAGEGLTVLTGPAQEIKGGSATWRLNGEKEGTYDLAYSFGNELYKRSVIITNGFKYASPLLTKSKPFGSSASTIKKDSMIQRISVDLRPLRPFGNIAFFGWQPGWLATYIIFSLVTSMLIRKWMKVY